MKTHSDMHDQYLDERRTLNLYEHAADDTSVHSSLASAIDHLFYALSCKNLRVLIVAASISLAPLTLSESVFLQENPWTVPG